MEISIRKMELSDMKVLMRIKKAEKWNQTKNDWRFLIRDNSQLCLVATTDMKVIGTITALNYQNKLAWIGMMLVDQHYRGKGISKLLLNTIIKKLDTCKTIKLDATPAGIPVYKKLGFTAEYDISRMVVNSPLANYKIPPPQDNLSLSVLSQGDLDSIIKFDKIHTGVKRDSLFRFLHNSNKESGFVLKDKSRVRGFVFSRPGTNFTHAGPVIANNFKSAKILLTSLFQQLEKHGHPIVIDILADKIQLNSWLTTIGFKHQRTFTRMYLKSNHTFGNINNHFAICGPEFG